MFHLIGSLATIAIAGGSRLLDTGRREIPQTKLRYVDAVLGGVPSSLMAATAVAAAVVWLLPSSAAEPRAIRAASP